MPPDPFEEEAQCLAGRGEFLCLLVAHMFAGMLG